MIDVHSHLNFHAFRKDVDEVIKRAQEKGVSHIINVGTKLDSSQRAVDLAQIYNNLYAVVGIHPHHADKQELGIKNYGFSKGMTGVGDPDLWVKRLEHLARQPKVVAIGEIGMDYLSYQSNGIVDPKLQKEIFEAQIHLAHVVDLPIQIHGRQAGKDILEILHHHKNMLKTKSPGMFHCFAGDTEILKGALDLGFCIGFDGNSTYPGLAPGETVSLSGIAKATPLDRIVTETDSPLLAPIPFRGSRNEPSHVILIGEFLARIKGISFEEFDRMSTNNAKRIFNIE